MRCLSDAKIEDLAQAEREGRKVATPGHLRRCARCAARFEAARAESRVVAELRELRSSRQAVQHLVPDVVRRSHGIDSGSTEAV